MDLIAYNSQLLPEYETALEIAKTYLSSMQREFGSAGKRNPIASIESRLKTFESTKEKCERKKVELEPDSIRRGVRDIAGIRIVCTFKDDIYTVFDCIRKMPNIMITDKKDYVEYPKENGYSSLHVIVSVPVPMLFSGSRLVPLEIQIRDIAMDMWATIEHTLKYKNRNPNPNTAERLRATAEHLRNLDEEIIALRDEAKN